MSRFPSRAFNTGEPLAYFLTWTTYGTWLTGDDRGWHRRGDSESRRPDSFLVEMAASRMKETPFVLSPGDRTIVETTIRAHCQLRGWQLHAVNVRSNHVHALVTAVGYRPETVRDQFKGWSSRKLKEASSGRKRFWTAGGSCRWINQEGDLEALVIYVQEAQDRKGLDE